MWHYHHNNFIEKKIQAVSLHSQTIKHIAIEECRANKIEEGWQSKPT